MANFSWSHSRLKSYSDCPLRFYRTKVERSIVEPDTEQILWGNRVHKAFEDNIRENKPLEPELSRYDKILSQFRSIPGEHFAERKFAVDSSYQPTDFESDKAWCRCITDLFVLNGDIACAFDWKTGKPKTDHDQLELNALLIFAHYPEVVEVKTAYVWLKDRKLTKFNFKRSGPGAPSWARYITQVGFMQNSYKNNFWPARKSGLCKNYCPVTTCKHNGRYTGE